MNGTRISEGWDLPHGGRIRLARPGEVPAADALLDPVGVRVESLAAQGVDDGSLATLLKAGLDGGQNALALAVATAIAGKELKDAVPGLSLLLVAEDPQRQIVGALTAMPPYSVVAALADRGVSGERLAFLCMVIAKISGLAVADTARGRGIGTQLLKRATQIYQQLSFQLVYGQFDDDSATLPAFYASRGFTVKAVGESEDLSVFLGVPLAVHSGPTERLFTRWRR
ncbi:GNAT family N-acetyltransferase [Streptacidiphilus sp. N1-12]|uniref:GNAT family N-acetyltransferase n=1 Tax=Streptacidiphilus alkalitolerans TaxID=3342712 RepID=A0ABV6WSE3_9ACTN